MCRFVNDRDVSSSATVTLNGLCLISIPDESLLVLLLLLLLCYCCLSLCLSSCLVLSSKLFKPRLNGRVFIALDSPPSLPGNNSGLHSSTSVSKTLVRVLLSRLSVII